MISGYRTHTMFFAAAIAACVVSYLASGAMPGEAQAKPAPAAGMVNATPQVTVPDDAALFNSRSMIVRPERLRDLTFEQVKDTVLWISWDNGGSWTKRDEKIENVPKQGKSPFIYKLTVDRDGLAGFYEVCPQIEGDKDPTPGTKPRKRVYVDSQAPRCAGVMLMRSATPGKVKIVWGFNEEIPALATDKTKGTTLDVNGTKTEGLPTCGELDVDTPKEGAINVTVQCIDRAANKSKKMTASLDVADVK